MVRSRPRSDHEATRAQHALKLGGRPRREGGEDDVEAGVVEGELKGTGDGKGDRAAPAAAEGGGCGSGVVPWEGVAGP